MIIVSNLRLHRKFSRPLNLSRVLKVQMSLPTLTLALGSEHPLVVASKPLKAVTYWSTASKSLLVIEYLKCQWVTLPLNIKHMYRTFEPSYSQKNVENF